MELETSYLFLKVQGMYLCNPPIRGQRGLPAPVRTHWIAFDWLFTVFTPITSKIISLGLMRIGAGIYIRLFTTKVASNTVKKQSPEKTDETEEKTETKHKIN